MEQIIEQILKHIAVLNDEFGQISIDVAVLKSQMADMVWIFRTLTGSVIVLVVGQVYQIFQYHKNGKIIKNRRR